MAKDPAFLFYPNDWLGGTIGMSFEEKGAYMELLIAQFNLGHMTSHMVGHMVGHLWVKVQVKFKQDEDGLWYNERLDEEIKRRKKFTESRRNNLSGRNQHTKKEEKQGGHMRGHMTSHMENENENINTIVSYLNITAKKNFSAKTKMTARIISARLKQGRTIDEFKKVIDTKTKQWINNPDMNKYLSPDTLFAEKNMEKYLMEETNPSNSSVGQTALSEKNIAKLI